jgi:hypothetical protein
MRRAAFATAIALVACSHGNDTAAPAPSASAVASATSPPTPSATPSARPATSGPSAWTGTYTATVGTLTIPDWTGVKFRGEDASVGLGPGTMSVALDATGRATGTLDGALGESTVDGALRDTAFSATLVPTNPATGFSGTAVGTRSGDAITGTMRLALPTGNVVREASFTLAPKK